MVNIVQRKGMTMQEIPASREVHQARIKCKTYMVVQVEASNLGQVEASSKILIPKSFWGEST